MTKYATNGSMYTTLVIGAYFENFESELNQEKLDHHITIVINLLNNTNKKSSERKLITNSYPH